jgi:hypothetical protein
LQWWSCVPSDCTYSPRVNACLLCLHLARVGARTRRVLPAAQLLLGRLQTLQRDGDALGALQLGTKVGSIMERLQTASATLSGTVCASAGFNGTLVASLQALVRDIRTALPLLPSTIVATSDQTLASLDGALQAREPGVRVTHPPNLLRRMLPSSSHGRT